MPEPQAKRQRVDLGNIITISVPHYGGIKELFLHKSYAMRSSSHFRTLASVGRKNIMLPLLPETEVAIVEVYLDWLYTGQVKYVGDESPTFKHLIMVYRFSVWAKDSRFRIVVIDDITKHLTNNMSISFDDCRTIKMSAAAGSPLYDVVLDRLAHLVGRSGFAQVFGRDLSANSDILGDVMDRVIASKVVKACMESMYPARQNRCKYHGHHAGEDSGCDKA